MAKKTSKNPENLLIVFLFLLSAAAAAGGFFAYKFLYVQKGPDNKIPNIRLKKETITFVYENLPDVYNRLLNLSDEVRMINIEIDRLDKIEKDFPKQKKIVISEKKVWLKMHKNLMEAISKLEKSIEMIHVSYSVNSEKGVQIIKDKNPELLAASSRALETSKEKTQRLKIEKK